MDLLVLFCCSCLSFCSAATQCHDNQHCSDCDITTGYCITDCDRGYYDQKCKSVCSKNCRNNTCITSNSGSENCTDGCVVGYHGSGCNIPCDSPGGSCTACPGGCDGIYCQLGSSCVSGCVDSYYGSGCTSCSFMCTSCSRLTGICDDKSGQWRYIALVASSVVCVFCIIMVVVAYILNLWDKGQ
ncbi:scavenger receptor class F member 1-like [Haliotis rubra]|uniref:scavenger receptor class F member 1-like n=1 Tax=Haliotis rubra TaxID=36100 RepID=UPI001EE60E0A|nr:scavenger receptor class F member 1-like [Haliotis rubra]